MKEPQTFGDLRQILDSEPDGDWPSRVNRGMTHTQALCVLRDGLIAYPSDMLITEAVRGGLYCRNVLKECRGHVALAPKE